MTKNALRGKDLAQSTSCACPTYRIIERLSKKWSLLIIRTLTERKHMRFSEIAGLLPEINSRILSERLSELEEEGLIRRVVDGSKPIMISYEVTEKGMDLRKIFLTFNSWAKKWSRSDSGS